MSRSGEFRSRVTLRKPVKTRSDYGDMVTSYEDVATVWAVIEWKSGKRFEAAAALNAEVDGVVRIRYRSDVRADWRIRHGNRQIAILSLANIHERDREIHLTCKEAQA